MNWGSFQKHFKFTKPSALLKELYRTKNKKENRKLVDLIKSGLRDLKDEIKEMSENEIEIERPDELVDLVQEILEFNGQNQEGQGLEILTPQQMLNRLPISLAQLQTRNNLQKLKNKTRQLLYSLCRSKKLSKTIYNSLMNTI